MSLLEDIKKEDSGMSLLDELENTPEESGEYTESEQWRPDPGDGIEGIVIETFNFPSKYANADGVKPTIPGLVLQVDGDDTPWSVVGLHSVLRGEIEKQDPQVGDRVAVIYTGKRPTKNGENEYEHYRMAVRRGASGGKPVPAQRAETRKPGQQSTQHEDPPAKKKPASRKPGVTTSPKPAAGTTADDPDF